LGPICGGRAGAVLRNANLQGTKLDGGRLAVTVARLPDLDPVMMDDWDGEGAAV